MQQERGAFAVHDQHVGPPIAVVITNRQTPADDERQVEGCLDKPITTLIDKRLHGLTVPLISRYRRHVVTDMAAAEDEVEEAVVVQVDPLRPEAVALWMPSASL
jgi:hypothetical protein